MTSTALKRERMEKRFYKLVAAGKYEEAERLMLKIVDMDAKGTNKINAKGTNK